MPQAPGGLCKGLGQRPAAPAEAFGELARRRWVLPCYRSDHSPVADWIYPA